MKFKSSDNATPSEPSARAPYNPRVLGTIAPTVVEPADIAKRELIQKAKLQAQEMDGLEPSPQLEKELNSLGVPDDMQKFLQIALRKPHLITVTYVSNSGKFQHHVNAHSRFPKKDVAGVLDHLKHRAEVEWLGRPDMTGIFNSEIAKRKKPTSGRGGSAKRRRRSGRR